MYHKVVGVASSVAMHARAKTLGSRYKGPKLTISVRDNGHHTNEGPSKPPTSATVTIENGGNQKGVLEAALREALSVRKFHEGRIKIDPGKGIEVGDVTFSKTDNSTRVTLSLK